MREHLTSSFLMLLGMSEWWQWWINDPQRIQKEEADGVTEQDRVNEFVELEQGSKEDQKFAWWFMTKSYDDPVFDDDPDPDKN
ncbi:hypothetical protein H6G89_32775 [Oscillatoria sp. FACHB-1407]|uniref:hypothetical protein n=1 Tax=Oscillatoria sp. FACHB-1407 TaxID=2692847 RepID=UPI0016875DE5|nr:hypothetical protein [Oscillatoria sp. FACHB-1407]MBD2465765.1 hypothetical protein [Oscillatoria sp. FACHB-1407]